MGNGFIATEMQQQGLAGYYSAMLDDIYNGMIIEYYIQAVNSEGIVQTFPSNAPDNTVIFIIGDFPDFYSNDYEDGLGEWIGGDIIDNASAGIWELAQPIATYDDENNQIQPGEDHTDFGSSCFITGNGYEDGNGGFDDVDGGKTTLFSPIFSLESFDEAIISYWYWYTNNVGDNAGNDLWQVLVSNNGGSTWQELYVSSNSTNEWKKQRFILSNYIELTDDIQFKFIAEDLFYDGDAGSGGSLVEAALDDFLIEYIISSSGVLGDINGDDVVDVLDVVLVVNMVLGVDSPNYALADINSDNEVNVQDIILLLNIILES